MSLRVPQPEWGSAYRRFGSDRSQRSRRRYVRPRAPGWDSSTRGGWFESAHFHHVKNCSHYRRDRDLRKPRYLWFEVHLALHIVRPSPLLAIVNAFTRAPSRVAMRMTMANTDDTNQVKEFIEAGSEIAGSAAGAALGFLGGGAPDAVGGAAAGPLITRSIRWAAAELNKRFLGPREEIRVGAVMAFAAEAVERRLKAGEKPRTDDFFKDKQGERSSGDEIVEATLLVAQRDSEERKLPYLGRLLASIAFTPRISRADANQLIQQLSACRIDSFCFFISLLSADSLGPRISAAKGSCRSICSTCCTTRMTSMSADS
jgi:hypothetical protein